MPKPTALGGSSWAPATLDAVATESAERRAHARGRRDRMRLCSGVIGSGYRRPAAKKHGSSERPQRRAAVYLRRGDRGKNEVFFEQRIWPRSLGPATRG